MAGNRDVRRVDSDSGTEFRFFWFSELLKKAVRSEGVRDPLGRLSDMVFRLAEPYPEAVGICLDRKKGKSAEFVPWNRVTEIAGDAIIVGPPEEGAAYGPFVDQPGWMLLDQHLMGKTILDTDGRRVEKVNDVHLLESRGRLVIAHVDISLNGFLRRWGMGRLRWLKDDLISWRYVQPFSLEDAARTDTVSLSVAKEESREMPAEDLADVLEVLSGEEQEAFFSALDIEKAAETLIHAEARAKRQLIEDLPRDRAKAILAELSIPQTADLFSVLPYDDVTLLMEMLPEGKRKSVRQIMGEKEVKAAELMSSDYLAFAQEVSAGEVLKRIRGSGLEPETISYLYVTTGEGVLLGVVDIRELVLAPDDSLLGAMMSVSVVSAEEGVTRQDLEDIFAKYHFRMIPVVDGRDRLLGIIRYNDLVQNLFDQKV